MDFGSYSSFYHQKRKETRDKVKIDKKEKVLRKELYKNKSKPANDE